MNSKMARSSCCANSALRRNRSSAPLNIEEFPELLCYLRANGHLGSEEQPRLTVLQGGVSNRTILVERSEGQSMVIKQALERLRVLTDWRSDPRRIEREARGLEWLARLAPRDATPALLFLDPRHHLLAMEAVPQPHTNWKTELLAGKIESKYIEQFGRLLATIHRRSREQRSKVAPEFDDRTFFETLRLEPYYEYTATRVAQARPLLESLVEETRSQRLALVHGDYSPKNILIYRGRLVLLDHEVIHFGDPAFDLGFSMTHLLSKAHYLPRARKDFLDAALFYWNTYQLTAPEISSLRGFQWRAVRHLLACLLARVEGRSPLEYLSPAQRERQCEIVLRLARKPPATVEACLRKFEAELNCHAKD
jgi:aminoglycoside phosphotransferase (APT) family kinase protein